MKLAVNYSPAAAALVTAGQIELDYFKTPPWQDMIAAALPVRPVTVHFELRAGGGDLDQTDFAAIEAFLQQTGTAYVNLHLNAKRADFGLEPGNPEKPGEARVLERLIQDVQIITRQFGAERVIAENVPYRAKRKGALRACIEPQVIQQVIQATGCGFLLDISHARITAHTLGLADWEYLAALPVQQLKELHFTGIHDFDGYQQDHLSILPGDWQYLDAALQHIQRSEWGAAHMLAFEYGGVGEFFAEHTDPAVLAEQIPQLYERLNSPVSTSS